MTCFSPLPARYGDKLTKNKKFKVVVLKRSDANLALYTMRVPCGQCIGCRLDYSRQWAVRMMHEAWLHECSPDNPFGRGNCFITLTYNDKFLPKNSSLDLSHWTKFMKRLRKRFGSDIRFYMGPEYSDSGRPHYHALLFNFDFPDRFLHMMRGDFRLDRSLELEKLWSCPKSGESYGYSTVGSATFASAAYIARYMMKKVKGDDLSLRYFTDLDLDTGEIIPLEPEKARMSNRPGIGKEWFDLFSDDLLRTDEVIIDGRKCKPPKYYDLLFERLDPEAYEFIKQTRVLDAERFSDNNTEDRLEIRRICKEKQVSQLVRNISL